MNCMIDFSIIIPAYNTEALIGLCLDSLECQDYPHDRYEIIVINDCSPDNLVEVVRTKQEIYNNIILLSTESNVRQGGARNMGLRKAQGRYVMFVDSDDVWIREDVLSTFIQIFKISEKISFAESSDYEVIGSDDLKIHTKSANITNFSLEYLTSTERIHISKNLCTCWLSCYQKDYLLINELFFAEGVFYEDTDWRLMCVAKADKIAMVDFVFYGYRSNPHSTTMVYTSKLQYDGIAALKRILNWVHNTSGLKNADVQKIKERVFCDIVKIKSVRHYRMSDSYLAFKQVAGMHIFGVKTNIRQRFLFWIMTHTPALVYIPIRGGYLLKCWIRKIICS